MNVVLTQLREKYGIPKGVMHYIVHFVRPRAPPRPEWEPWRVSSSRSIYYRILEWYRFKHFANTAPYEDIALDMEISGGGWVSICCLCLTPNNKYVTYCDHCYDSCIKAEEACE